MHNKLEELCLLLSCVFASCVFSTPHHAKVGRTGHLWKLASDINNTFHEGSHIAWNVDWHDLTDTSRAVKSALSLTSRSHHSAASNSLQGIMGCINGVYNSKAMTWMSAVNGTIADLKVVAGFYNTQADSVPVTLATFATLSRLEQLSMQCKRWQGPLSVVLYEALLQPPNSTKLTKQSRRVLKFALIEVVQLIAKLLDTPDPVCQLRVLLSYEIVHEAAAQHLIPQNLLRNYARIQVQTPLMVALDIDLLPSKSLYTRTLNTANELYKQTYYKKTVYIVPTFESGALFSHAAWADALSLLEHKAVLLAAMDLGIVQPFQHQSRPAGQNITNFTFWKLAQADYPTTYEPTCEPWLLTSSHLLPWHDNRFRGYGYDRVQHIYALYLAGYKFKVLHDSFTVHRMHEHSAARSFFMNDTLHPQGLMAWGSFVKGLFRSQINNARSGLPYNPKYPKKVIQCLAEVQGRGGRAKERQP